MAQPPRTDTLPQEVQDLIKRKDERIRELEERMAALEKEKEDMAENFQSGSNVLLERIKELESSTLGARPQTANILERIGIGIP